MNRIKEAYKETIADFIVDSIWEISDKINAPNDYTENKMNELQSTRKYLRNLIKTITAESEEEIDERIKSHKPRKR